MENNQLQSIEQKANERYEKQLQQVDAEIKLNEDALNKVSQDQQILSEQSLDPEQHQFIQTKINEQMNLYQDNINRLQTIKDNIIHSKDNEMKIIQMHRDKINEIDKKIKIT